LHPNSKHACNSDDSSTPSDVSNGPAVSETLQEAVEREGLSLDTAKLQQLDTYCRALWEWNTKLNLTRHTNYDLFVRRDLLDSLRLADQLREGEEILDVGTGGGVPGLLLAILRPDLSVSLCDSVAKKAKATQDIVDQMQLPVAVYPERVQSVLQDLRFHSLVARAVGSISRILAWLADDWLSFDRLMLIKGPKWIAERGEARHRGLMANLELRKVDSYPMPGTESESVILQISPKPR
jgi:16S rRNA (guanine527-N7)-methyltransferase